MEPKKSPKTKKTVEIKYVAVTDDVPAAEKDGEQFPAIRRMIIALDKFLNRRIAVIAIVYLAGMIACGAGLIVNGVYVSAHTGGKPPASNEINIWLISVMVTLTFVFFLISVRVFAQRRRKNEKP